MSMKIHALILGALSTNCYIIEDEKTKKCAVIDPADQCERIISEIEKLGLSLEMIILTHVHFDHMEALNGLYEKTGAEVFVGSADIPALSYPALNLSSSFGSPFVFDGAVSELCENDIIWLGDTMITVMETPGHTPGSVCLLLKEENVIFSGDTVFAGSIGRTDFPGGNFTAIINSLKRVLSLDKTIKIFSGHGPETTVARELSSNPFYLRYKNED